MIKILLAAYLNENDKNICSVQDIEYYSLVGNNIIVTISDKENKIHKFDINLLDLMGFSYCNNLKNQENGI